MLWAGELRGFVCSVVVDLFGCTLRKRLGQLFFCLYYCICGVYYVKFFYQSGWHGEGELLIRWGRIYLVTQEVLIIIQSVRGVAMC